MLRGIIYFSRQQRLGLQRVPESHGAAGDAVAGVGDEVTTDAATRSCEAVDFAGNEGARPSPMVSRKNNAPRA
jgi:hypothetical protein